MAGHPILIVDDDETSLRIARFALEAEGFVVYQATDALSTLETLKTVNPAVIVMDIQLPGMDGWELTRRLKANLATCHIPIVAITAYAADSDKQNAAEAGFAAYVDKLSTTDDLPEIIRRHMQSEN